ncbi:MAG: Fis family transcriptional regulator [Polyangiaceae bacterium]|nr:Fis family transcriptional regulator [Polyangiaceae bacterium]
MPGLALRLALACLLAPFASACGDGGDGGSGGSGGSGAGGPGGDTEPPAMAGMTAAHNAARASVDPPAASPIPPLSWSGEIAAIAQAYSEGCNFEHSTGDLGENLYATTGSATPADVVASWVEEKAFYDYSSNACSDVCGHYTQVVWADSLKLGCGVTNCTQNSPFNGGGPGEWQFWVCNYDPPGNYIGQKPY